MQTLATLETPETALLSSAGSHRKPKNAARQYRVLVHGLPHFCQKLPALLGSEKWEIRDRSRHRPADLAALGGDLRRCDLAYLWGGRISMGRFLWAARMLGKTKIVMLWSGSDVLFAQHQRTQGKMHPWVAGRIHWAVSPALAAEVRALGLSCEHVQASFVDPLPYPKRLPEKFSVLLYMPSADRADLYGWDIAVEAARALPSMEFRLVGLKHGEVLSAPPNVKVHNWVSDLAPFIEQATVVWRPVRHDAGTSFMVLEALAHGRHVLYTYPHPGCIQATNAKAAGQELVRLLHRHASGTLRLNESGIKYVAENCTAPRVRSELLRRWEEIILSPNLARGDGQNSWWSHKP